MGDAFAAPQRLDRVVVVGLVIDRFVVGQGLRHPAAATWAAVHLERTPGPHDVALVGVPLGFDLEVALPDPGPGFPPVVALQADAEAVGLFDISQDQGLVAEDFREKGAATVPRFAISTCWAILSTSPKFSASEISTHVTGVSSPVTEPTGS